MNFATASSTIIAPEYISTHVINNYKFPSNTVSEILRTGINHTYLIKTSTEKFIFRVYFYNWRTENEITEELNLLDFLKENNILVSYPIKDKEDTYIQHINTFEGNRFGVLFSYAGGETIRNPSEEVCYHLGVSMAKMHQKLVNKTIHRKNHNPDTLVKWAIEKISKKLPNSIEEINYFKKAYKLISEKFKEIEELKIKKGVVHLDIWHDNIKVKNEKEITFFDFDNCGNGYLFLDFSYTLMLFFRNDPNPDHFLNRKENFLKGYESITPISNEEKSLIPYGGLAIWLHYSGQHAVRFDDFANHFLSADFLKYWINTVDNWMKFNKIEV